LNAVDIASYAEDVKLAESVRTAVMGSYEAMGVGRISSKMEEEAASMADRC
jgi:hypothetical protein